MNMKRYGTLLIVAIVGLSVYSCKQDKPVQAGKAKNELAKNPNQEGVFLDYNVQDVGAIPRDKPITVKVVIINNKPDSITITGTPTTCDCMNVSLQKKNLGPKDTAQMAVTYNARIPGLFDKDVYVNFMGQDSTLKFTMKGHVKQ